MTKCRLVKFFRQFLKVITACNADWTRGGVTGVSKGQSIRVGHRNRVQNDVIRCRLLVLFNVLYKK